MPSPFLLLAVSLASGILLSSLVVLPLSVSVSGLVACLAAAWLAYFWRKTKLSLAMVLATVFFLGVGLYSQADQNYRHNSLTQFDFNGYADFIGRLFRSPSYGADRTYLYLKAESIRYLGREQKVEGNLRVAVLHASQYPSPLDFKAGDRIMVSAQIQTARDYRNFDEPRLANLRQNQNIHNSAVSKSPLLVELVERGKRPSLRRLISSLKLLLQHAIENDFSTPDRSALTREGAVLEALLLGERGRMDETATLALQKSGLYHLIAISGAHIAIISFLLFGLLRLCRIPRRPSYAVLIVLLVFFAMLVEGRASVFRATIMAIVYLVGRLLWKKANFLNTISFSAFLLLLANPFSLFDMGFELTYAATLSIILFFPRLVRFLPRLPLRLTELFTLSLTAQLGVLPFIARSFHRVAFASLFLNLLAMPLIGLIMGIGLAYLAFSFLSAFMANSLAQVLTFLIRLFLGLTRLLEAIPAFSYRVPTPPLGMIIGYFTCLLLLVVPTRFKRQRLLTLALFLAFLFILITYPFPAKSSPGLRLTFLDVGQGDSILVEFPGRKKMLVDGGGVPVAGFYIGEQVVSPFLWSKGIKRIDYVVLTHAHPDHMNGLLAVARNFRIGQFWEAFSPLENSAYDELKSSLGPTVTQKRVFQGFKYQEGEVRLEALNPEAGGPSVQTVNNEDSVVLRVSLDAISFLLAADIGYPAEGKILKKGLEVRSQVLKSPHHGSRSSSSAPFLERVRPRIIVIMAGRNNPYGVPNREVLDLYESVGAKIFRTDADGAVEISSDGRMLSIRTARQPKAETD
jgi:competence protein ComEC